MWCGVVWYGVVCVCTCATAWVWKSEATWQQARLSYHTDPKMLLCRCVSVSVCLRVHTCELVHLRYMWKSEDNFKGSHLPPCCESASAQCAPGYSASSVSASRLPTGVPRSHMYTTASGSSNVGSGDLCQAAGLLRKLFYPLRRLAALTLVWDRVSR